MTLRRVMIALLAFAVIAVPLAGTVAAQAKEMFIPSLVYRTGPYAPSGIPFANGLWDYLTMLNEVRRAHPELQRPDAAPEATAVTRRPR